MSKLWNYLERNRWSVDGFANLIDECRRSVAKESRALADVNDSVGLEPHESRTGCVSSYRIIRKHDRPQSTGTAVERDVYKRQFVY